MVIKIIRPRSVKTDARFNSATYAYGLANSYAVTGTKNRLYKSRCDSELGALVKTPLRWMTLEP